MAWHALSVKEVIGKLNSDEKGLSEEDVRERVKKFGENRLKKTTHFNGLKVFLEQFKSFLIIILILAALLSFFMRSSVDAIVIVAILLLNAGLGFFQEYKAEKAIEELRKMMVNEVKVIRDGKIVIIDSKKLVPGDILILSEGDKIMADARLLKVDGLKINEASLTGESVPENKIINKLGFSLPLADRTNMIYQGTQVVSGSGKAIVVDTGMNTELGKISELVQEVKPEKNPFKDKLDRFAKKIGIFIIILSVIIIVLLIMTGSEVLESLLVAVSLAVSAIPEGLPAVISLGLAFATRKMIKKNVLIRKLPASETLGRVTVICTDKTGTLTEEKMTVSSVYTNGKIILHPEGLREDKKMVFKIGVLCNNARYENSKEGRYYVGDPTETALIVSAEKNALDKKKLTEQNLKVREFAFDSNRKMMSVIRETDKKLVSYVKGAPEKIIENCDYEFINGRKIKLSKKDKIRLTKIYETFASHGLRVLGFAYKEVREGADQNQAESELIFTGFQGMIDPPRKEVKDAIRLCKEAGIKVIMITGDSKLTADAVAEEIGLNGESVESNQLQKMSDRELFDKIKNISVFSRISPKDKLRIVNILKKRNEIVAMTGDGVNDALALKRADIGIAMGIRGTDVARDASQIVLVDDNFASIVEGVKEGRRIYDNVKKFVKYLLTANFSQVFLVLIVTLIWRDPSLLPLLPLQILWINLVTDSFPALALSAEAMEINIMKRKPSKKGILNGITSFILIGGFIAFLIGFLFFYLNMHDIDKARTMVVTSSVIFEMMLVFNCKSEESAFKKSGLFGNKYLVYAVLFSIGLHLIVLYTPLNSLFYFIKLGLNDWLMLVGVSFIGFLIMEVYKWKGRNK